MGGAGWDGSCGEAGGRGTGGGRYGGSELHSVAAAVGGIGAQEVTKVLLRQFVPAGGTFVFNGVTGKSAVCVF
jgi:hypothetical protein